MPFIGKNPTAGFASIVKDDFTPNGSTTVFTLSKQVATANDIAVFVGNVRQEPTDAYTVSGTTLTMSAAPATGINFYVLHIAGTIESSVVPPDGSIGTAKLVNNAVTSAKLDTNIDIAGILTSAGNLLVGKTTSNYTTDGLEFRSDGQIFSSVDGNYTSYLNRKTSDGDILILAKNAATVGSIGVDNGDNAFFSGNSSHSGIMFGTESLIPYANGSTTDATEDLGTTSLRWRNLYLSGGAYLGGTTSANYLDDYEEGTFTPTVTDLSGNSASGYSAQAGYYTKIGNMVYAVFRVALTNKGSITGNYTLIKGLPFNHAGADGGSGIVNRYQNLNNAVSGLSIELGGGVPTAGWFTQITGTSGTSDTYLQTADVSNTFFAQGILIYRTS